MNFGNLQSLDGIHRLNAFLTDKSYIKGYCPTQTDCVVFESIDTVPSAEFENVLRWYNHIASFSKVEREKFQGQNQSVVPIDDNYNDFDPFADEDEEESNLKKQRREEYEKKKREKPIVIAKSELVLDVKPWDDETNMKELEENVRSIKLDGLVWSGSRLVPLAYGIYMLQITCVVEDDKVGTDLLEERITAFEDHVQSMDVSAFRKI